MSSLDEQHDGLFTPAGEESPAPGDGSLGSERGREEGMLTVKTGGVVWGGCCHSEKRGAKTF